MTTTVPSSPPARAVKRLRMTRSRILSSAPPMIITVPSVDDRRLLVGATLRERIRHPGAMAPTRRRVQVRARTTGTARGRATAGAGSGRVGRNDDLVGQRLLPGSSVDSPEIERGKQEQDDRCGERGARPVARPDRPAEDEEQQPTDHGREWPGGDDRDV